MTEIGASKKEKLKNLKNLAIMIVRETYQTGGGVEYASSSPNNMMDTAEDIIGETDDNIFVSVNNTAGNSTDRVHTAGIRKDENEE